MRGGRRHGGRCDAGRGGVHRGARRPPGGARHDDRVVPVGWPDVVLLLDVLGHLDAAVAAYRWLWNGHEVVLGHRRRDRAARLRAVVEAAGFTVASLSYFNMLPLPCGASVLVIGRR